MHLRQGTGGHEGLVAEPSIRFTDRAGPYRYSLGLRSTFASAKYTQVYFGVTPEQAARAGLRDEAISGHKRIPPIQCLLTFEALARLRSVTQTAEELCVTPSAVSAAVPPTVPPSVTLPPPAASVRPVATAFTAYLSRAPPEASH